MKHNNYSTKSFLSLAFLLFTSLMGKVHAQDPNFSQFFTSPITLNPALTGKFEGDIRVAGNYRNQWPSINRAFITSTVSVDFGIMKNKLPEGDQFGVGIMAFTDKAGNGVLNNNYFGISTAYHKGLDVEGLHQIGVGFQGVYSSKRIDGSKLLFEDMLTPFGFTGVTQETFDQSKLSVGYMDLNAGFLYTGSTNGENSFYLGASVYHLTRPKETFNNGNFVLNSRATIHAGGTIPLANYNAIHLSANHSMQAGARNTMIGGAYSLNANNDPDNPTNVYLGTWVRLKDAVIPYIGLEFNEWRFGATYDVNVSKLRTASNSRGGIEISMIYTRKHRDGSLRKFNCPKF